jgi:hypothetical protein
VSCHFVDPVQSSSFARKSVLTRKFLSTVGSGQCIPAVSTTDERVFRHSLKPIKSLLDGS